MLCVILAARLHAMYERSRKMLIFLIVTLLAVTITIGAHRTNAEEFILWGAYTVCAYLEDYDPFRTSFVAWMLGIMWEVLAMCLAVWIAVRHLRELQQRPTGSTTGDYLTVLIKSHIYYFAG
ncbi:hypothetical protein AZE42_07095 [Rhizopogon vesiculosus]|uniref:Uncharacterized protein n=1 Tax=Rhizopogon vesiculosus TaxID=180088 RepID=A0A1J8R0G6_9AGAM|nr:hypothetical protein AZE42_07095 [Rhizopogon vesiculosus]